MNISTSNNPTSPAPICTPEREGLDSNSPQDSAPAQEPEGPPLCECAYVGKRALSWAFWIEGLSRGTPGGSLDRRNLEFAHEHIRWEATGDNIGFGPDGLFSEDLNAYQYRWDPTCYDGSLLRKAIQRLGVLQSYNFFSNNCQDFVARLRAQYEALRGR